MDVMMPKQDGVEACREIMESAPETCVLMLTASTEEDAVVEAVAACATVTFRRRPTGSNCCQPCGTWPWAIFVFQLKVCEGRSRRYEAAEGRRMPPRG